MLGQWIHDPEHVESLTQDIEGLGLLPTETFFLPEKATYQIHAQATGRTAWLASLSGCDLQGYEIHMGRTNSVSTWLEIKTRNGSPCEISDGSMSADGRIWGCYLHGLFGNTTFRHAWLTSLGWISNRQSSAVPAADQLEKSLTYLADEVEAAVDMNKIERIIWAE